jgi:hypothetical protein
VKAGTSSHGLVITGCCPLLDFETKPSVSVFVFLWGLIVLKMVFGVFVELSSSGDVQMYLEHSQVSPLNVTWILKSQRKVDKNDLP